MKTFNNKQSEKENGQESENRVAKFLVDKGFSVSQVDKTNSNGIDIVAIKNGEHFLIEVKSPIYTSRSWRIKKSHNKADYVAWIMPNNEIYFAKRNDKDLHITSLIKIYKEF